MEQKSLSKKNYFEINKSPKRFCILYVKLATVQIWGQLNNSELCFPRISMFPSTSSRETLRFSGNKIHSSPRDQSLSVYCSTVFLETDHSGKMGKTKKDTNE